MRQYLKETQKNYYLVFYVCKLEANEWTLIFLFKTEINAGAARRVLRQTNGEHS